MEREKGEKKREEEGIVRKERRGRGEKRRERMDAQLGKEG